MCITILIMVLLLCMCLCPSIRATFPISPIRSRVFCYSPLLSSYLILNFPCSLSETKSPSSTFLPSDLFILHFPLPLLHSSVFTFIPLPKDSHFPGQITCNLPFLSLMCPILAMVSLYFSEDLELGAPMRENKLSLSLWI
jgi:hypothetical protein